MRIPWAPLLLGAAGLLPPLLGVLLVAADPGGLGAIAREGVLLYAALIFSFLGGSWWAFASQEAPPRWGLLLLAVVPSLLGWAALIGLPAMRAGLGLAALLVVSPLVDWRLGRRGLTPEWWMRLRVPLSVGLALCLALATSLRA